MGGGCWTKASYDASISSRGFKNKSDISKSNVQAFYKSTTIQPELNPYKVIRECRDSEEHPETLPIILALDVTGSMGSAAKACAEKLDEIMEELYKTVKDVEFLMMGIGDMAFDEAPVQASQFESDIRILDQTSKIWFEGGGGPNKWESYTAAWYFALYHTNLDCWKRDKKGIVITMGDEMLNPYLKVEHVNKVFGDTNQQQNLDDYIESKKLYPLVSEKYDVFHIGIDDPHSTFWYNKDDIHDTWQRLLGKNYLEGSSKDLPQLISAIVNKARSNSVAESTGVTVGANGIRW